MINWTPVTLSLGFVDYAKLLIQRVEQRPSNFNGAIHNDGKGIPTIGWGQKFLGQA